MAPKAFLDDLPEFFTLFRSPGTMWLWVLLPVLLAAGGIIGFWVVFAMAVANGSVNITEAFPYISTCGAYPPQSCLFGQVLNLGSFLGVVICFLKYQQVRDYGCHSRLNLIGLVLGIFCALGASMVGNFQQSNQLETHLFGAFLAFVVGILYFWIQTFLTNRVKPRHGGQWIASLRFSLSFCGSAFLIATVSLFYLKLDSESAYCEWALAMDLFLLFGLFAVDFWHIGTCSVHVHHQRADQESPDIQASTQTLSL
ncbi:modulator of macroautophagy TMEM150B isoform X1 [Anolis carolinensis]|uniref:CWH43-like N-terminal domain-containing protein n=2 Tax=Anolis carolinensis TaxID=28377 RepID=R4GB92_ANOCA|nr:PREDICTED: transmembrane protein 150B isoform X1 [Anolis carolinensis]|eukprot:XP_008116691.1 PREDICTED: transmembrane protein 150B isoform X1 [Anolis carolinensis]